MSDAEKLAVAAIALALVAAFFLFTALTEIAHSVELDRYGQITVGGVTARLKTVRYRSVRYEFGVNGELFTAGDNYGYRRGVNISGNWSLGQRSRHKLKLAVNLTCV